MINSCAAILIAAKHGELTKVRDASGITYTVGTLRCNFDFRTSDWDYTTRKAIFCKGNVATNPAIEDKAIGVYLDANNECAVPPEVLLPDEKYFSVGVWGATKEGLRIVSEWLVFKIKDGCYVDSVESIPPTPTIYEQIVAELSSKSPIDHNHDDKYYSKEYIDNKFENISIETGIPTKVSELENDAGYITEDDVNLRFSQMEQKVDNVSNATTIAEYAAQTAEQALSTAQGMSSDIQIAQGTANEAKELAQSALDTQAVDQTYGFESENAQSGKAVKQAIDGLDTKLGERINSVEGWFSDIIDETQRAINSAARAEEGLYNLTQEVGNIGAVLDELHAYAQGFIGGGE